MKRSIALLITCLVLLPTLATTVWKKNGTGGWNDPAQWDNGVPGSGNPAKFIDVTLTFTDADVANLNTAKLVPADDATLIFDFSNDQEISSSIQSQAKTSKVIKKGVGTLTLSGTSSDAYSYHGNGTVSVLEGTLRLPKLSADLSNKMYPILEAKAPARMELPGDRNFCVSGFSGDGTFAVTNYTAGHYAVVMGDTLTNRYEFSGTLEKGFYLKFGDHRTDYADFRPNQVLSGTANGKMEGSEIDFYRGNVSVVKFGDGTEENPGSLGYGAALKFFGPFFDEELGLTYAGTVDETVSRTIYFRGQNTTAAQTFYMDAGTHGGLTFDSEWQTANEGVDGKMYRLCLQGDNANACTISGKLTPMNSLRYTTLVKRGTGTWNLACGNKNTLRGPVHVERGTLGYNFVAGIDQDCALGRATALQTNFWGSADIPTVPYTVKIGNGENDSSLTALATLNYIGSSAVNMAVRPITLDGAGAFSGTTGVPMNWSGFAAAPSGGTLVLDGEANDGGKIVCDLKDGEGVLSLEKRGAGVWSVMGTNTLSGTVRVKAGTLVAVGDNAWYTWFRWTLKNMLAQPSSSNPALQEIALYDTDGVRQNAGLDYQYTGSYYPARLAENLPPGTVTYGSTGYYSMSGTPAGSRDLDNCFDDSIAAPKNVGWLVDAYPGGSSSVHPDGTTANYWRIVMHLGETVPKIAQYDFCGANVFGSARCPGVWSWEGSHDGQTWDPLVDYTLDASECANIGGYKWLGRRLQEKGGATFVAGRVLTADDTGFPVRGYSNTTGTSPLGTAAVRVDSGATLKANGSVSVNKLVVDVTTGAGTLDGVTLLAKGSIDCVGAEPGRIYDFTIGSANGTDLSKLMGWTLTLNGKSTERKLVYAGNGRFQLQPVGFMLIVR